MGGHAAAPLCVECYTSPSELDPIASNTDQEPTYFSREPSKIEWAPSANK